MSIITVAQFAVELNMSADVLLDQLRSAGASVSSVKDFVTNSDKIKLLESLRKAHGIDNNDKKIVLTKRETSEIYQADARGRSRTIQVKILKKRTFIKKNENLNKDLEKEKVGINNDVINKINENVGESSFKISVRDTDLVKGEYLDKEDSPINVNENIGNLKVDADSLLKPRNEDTEHKISLKNAINVPSKASVNVISNNIESYNKDSNKMESSSKSQIMKNPKNTINNRAATQNTITKTEKKPEKLINDREDSKKTSEAEAAALQDMLNRPRKVSKATENPAPKNNKNTSIKKDNKSSVSSKKSPKSSDVASSWSDESSRRKNLERDKRSTLLSDADGWKVSGIKTNKSSKNNKQNSNGSLKDSVNQQQEFIAKKIHVPETITVADLAHKMSIKAAEVIKHLMKLGQMVTINQVLDQETAMIVVEDLGHTAVAAKIDDPETFLDESNVINQSDYITRAPVVTVMGHVDHGKTSLLDYIRKATIASNEAGGITQHIGAYNVRTSLGSITFLDTPGHEAFAAMRARGAKATDIVVLVVAADDGVMPQTKEAISHVKSASIPMIVALTKADKQSANLDKVRQELISEGIVPEEYGGDIPFIMVSSKTGSGIDSLLEHILLQAEILELKASVNVSAKGVVIEASLDKGKGPISTVLIQNGTLKKGDVVLVGATFGRVRAMLDEKGLALQEAGPSIPVEIHGLTDVPSAGDILVSLNDERKAREIALFRQGKFRDSKLAKKHAANFESMFDNMADAIESRILSIIIKADVQGSQEALANSLIKLSTDEVKVKIIHAAVGGISDNDVNLAVASNAFIIGFNVKADAIAKKNAELNNVRMSYYNIIYDAINDVKSAMSGMLAPEKKEDIIGTVEIREVYAISKIGSVAGCMVTEGIVKKDSKVRLFRNNVVVWTGQIDSLRRFKDDVKEVRSGFDCGITLKGNPEIIPNDQLEIFEIKEIARTL
ncbi:translation initiation factor IF-2 [Candidatus Kinetoplastidibacterium crithidiae]|uniref:Translation initiation factor IF-2 n=1 Tax=Candidatus Kinetoplastidibacterium crithidiae TCC036E TaxID=1208918 RepID=M1LUB8_9PROT|nr:translation initiation factor IF-2 [Candidatus Kinetoplastibacterium crithidii]AFZ82643.1 translation initiation factor IF-2 [Candidatus Kinetoplastibacterium crithidii (ex Angomonas deanei ATCC 30255)]AGF47696.1 translation initiation factor IF-2 [Candidatus Kinetoplastibacterium crithidii TCC036E]